jgi:hypothetical protein
MASRARAKNTKGKVKGKAIAILPKKAKRKRPGDNGAPGPALGLSDEMKERWMKDLRKGLDKIAELSEETRQARSVYSQDRKRAKKDGFSLAGFDILERERKRDLGHVHQDYADAADLVRIDGGPLLEQLSLFQNMLPPEEKIDPVLQAFNAGKAGENPDNNPFNPGTAEFESWKENYERGQAVTREGLRS